MGKIWSILFFVVWCMVGNAQELPVYSQYILNPYLINPAIAGSAECGIVQVMSRKEWMGVNDSPTTDVLSYHQKLRNVGIGGYVYNDQNGNTGNTGFQLTYAYHIRLGDNRRYNRRFKKHLSFGLSFMKIWRTIDETGYTQTEGDPLVTGGIIQKKVCNNGDFGVYYSQGNFHTGLSCANIIPATYGIYSSQRTFFWQIIYKINKYNTFEWEPSLTTKLNKQWDWQIDANCKFNFKSDNEIKWFTAVSLRNNMMYSLKEGLNMMLLAGYNFKDFGVGIAYDYGLNKMRSSNYGSCEILISYKFNHSSEKPFCPAYE